MRLILSITILMMLLSCKESQRSNEVIEAPAKQSKVESDGIVITAQAEPDTLKGSIQAYASGKIGDVNVMIEYYSPAVRGRIIWGGLVPYNQVWVTGAHMATRISFDGALRFGDQVIEAGSYALFTIPSEEEWTVILNKNWKQHLTDKYDEREDILRFNLTPEFVDSHQERLMYLIQNDTLTMAWEKIKINMLLKKTKN